MGTLDDEILAGRYRLGPLLGRGGMADVHQGLDLRLDRAVAIKLLRPEMAAHPEVRRRFEEEARSAARLSHPHAVAVYDTGEDRGTPFIVMEQLPGETLADRIGQGPLGEDWVLGVAHDVLGALDAAHAAGLVHRDVKPANILIDAEGRAKVADFGIAKSVEVVGGQLDLTATDVLVGTPAYLAPERLNGEPASAQSDIWASGAVLFEALAGAKPFPGATPLAMVSAIQAGAPLSLRQLRPQVSPRTAGAVERAMAARPEDRYPTAAAMAEALGVLHLADGRRRAVEPGAVAVAGAAVAGAEATLVKAHGDEPAAQAGPASVWDDSDTRIDRRGALDAGGRGVAGLGAHRARLLLTAAAVLLAVAAAAVGLSVAGHRRSGAVRTPPPLGTQLRTVAAQVRAAGPDAGPRGDEAARRLEAVAAAVDAGGGGGEAQALVGDVESWQANSELAPASVGQVLGALAQVPGVSLAPPTTPSTDSFFTPGEGNNGNGNGHGNGNRDGGQGGGGD